MRKNGGDVWVTIVCERHPDYFALVNHLRAADAAFTMKMGVSAPDALLASDSHLLPYSDQISQLFGVTSKVTSSAVSAST